MSSPETAAPTSSPEAEDVADPRSDFIFAIGWTGLGIAILIGSVMMDRLEKQNINPYTIPGLLPGLLGIAIIILGILLAVRSWRTGVLASATSSGASNNRAEHQRLLLVLGLCLTFGVVLVGHGLPFWLASAIFVTVSILSLQYQGRKSTGQKLNAGSFIKAAVIGVGTGIVTSIVFQEIFLVRLP